MSLMDDLAQAVAQSSTNRGRVFKLPKNGSAEIRFMVDGNNGLKLPVHGRWISRDHPDNYTVPCAHFYKDAQGNPRECYWHDLQDEFTGTKMQFAWLIWNFTAGMAQAFVWKATRTSPLEQLGKCFATYGNTLYKRNFKVDRNGLDGFDTRHFITGCDPSPFSPPQGLIIPRTTEAAHAQILAYLAEAWYPQLLKVNEPLTGPNAGGSPVNGGLATMLGTPTAQVQKDITYQDAELEDADSLLPNI